MSKAITLNGVRFSYVHVFQPYQGQGQTEPKYTVTILVPKSNVVAKALIDQAIAQTIEEAVTSKWGGIRPPQPSICVHDGDGVRPSDGQPFGEECKGCWVFTASAKQAPFVVDTNVQPIIDPTQVYSGMYGNVSVTFFGYNQAGKKGIGCGLNGLQKTADGDPLGNRISAAEAFGAPTGNPVPAAPAGGYTPAATTGYAPAPVAPGTAGYPFAAPAAPIDPLTGLPVG